MNSVPEAGHHVERVVEQLDVVGPLVLREVVRESGTSLWNVPNARKLSTPGTAIGLSSRRSATFGWPMSVMPAIGPLSNRPSIAASATG